MEYRPADSAAAEWTPVQAEVYPVAEDRWVVEYKNNMSVNVLDCLI